MKKTIQTKWNDHPYTIEIDLEIPSVFFIVEGSMPPIVNRFEDFAQATFITELQPHGTSPNEIRWSYEVTTFSQIHSAEVKLTSFKKDDKIFFTDFKAVNVKVVNR